MEKPKQNCDAKYAFEECDSPTDVVRKRMAKRKEEDFVGESHLVYEKLNAMDKETLDILEKIEEGEQNAQ